MSGLPVADVPPPPPAPAPGSASEPPPAPAISKADFEDRMTWIKWEVCTGVDDYGNALWCEFPKDVSATLEAMYLDSSTREEAKFLYVCQICSCSMYMLQTMCFYSIHWTPPGQPVLIPCY